MIRPAQTAGRDRLKELFARLEPLDRREQQSILDTELRDEPGLRADLEELLEAYEGTRDDFLEPIVETADAIDTLAIPKQIGPYAIDSILGRGGMACVFRAEQEHPIRRVVALKVIRAGLDTGSVLGRFESERLALARLQHRNIATVLDAGADPYGPSWFAMELVDGPTITAYCDEQRPDLRSRLRLFVQICRGVQHAHSRGVLHRDLKPTNILVATEDGEPVPKIIDFGVAKALGADTSFATHRTLDTQLVGTLEYMSPEQARFGNPDIDARSDVYALGVVLYELLTGDVPVGGADFKDVPLDTVQARIQQKTPAKPSRASKVEVPSELDCVVLKALEKDRADRYQTANQLADEIERFLGGFPLEARSRTAGYTLRKLASRHRAATAAAGIVLLAVIGGIAALAAGLRVAQKEQRATQQALVEVDRARDAAEGVAAYFRGLLSEARPDALGPDASLREATIQEARLFLENPPASAAVRARVAQAFAAPMTAFNEFELADDLFDTAEQNYRADPAPESRAGYFDTLVEYGYSLILKRSLDRADEILGRALALAEQDLGPVEVLRARMRMADVLHSRGEIDEAHEARVAAVREAKDREAMPAGMTFAEVALVRSYLSRSQYDEVVRAGEEFLEPRSDFWSAPTPSGLGVISDMGMALRRLDRLDEARELMERAIPHFRTTYGNDSLYTLRAEATLCQILADLGEPDASDRLRTLLDNARQGGVPETQIAAYKPTLFAILLREGKLDEARSLADATVKTATSRSLNAALFTRLALAMSTDFIRREHFTDAHRIATAVRAQVARHYGADSQVAQACERLIADSAPPASAP